MYLFLLSKYVFDEVVHHILKTKLVEIVIGGMDLNLRSFF